MSGLKNQQGGTSDETASSTSGSASIDIARVVAVSPIFGSHRVGRRFAIQPTPAERDLDTSPLLSFPIILEKSVPAKRPSPTLSGTSAWRDSRHFGGKQSNTPHPTGSGGIPLSQTGAIHPLRMNPTGFPSSASMPFKSHDANSPSAETRAIRETTRQPKTLRAAAPSTGAFSQLVRQKGAFKKILPISLSGRLFSKNRTKYQPSSTTQHSGSLPSSGPIPPPKQATQLPKTEPHSKDAMGVGREKCPVSHSRPAQIELREGAGSHLASSRSVTDPFADSFGATRPPTEFDTRLRANSAGGSPATPLDRELPGSVRIGESSLHSRLPSPPHALATPRCGQGRCRAFAESPTRKSRAVTSRSTREHGTHPGSANFQGRPENQAACPPPGTFGKGKAKTSASLPGLAPVLSYTPIVENPAWKKHPSPAKDDLEALEREFCAIFPLPAEPAAKDEGGRDKAAPAVDMAPPAARRASATQKSHVTADSLPHDHSFGTRSSSGEEMEQWARTRCQDAGQAASATSTPEDAPRTRTIGTQTDGVIIIGGVGGSAGLCAPCGFF